MRLYIPDIGDEIILEKSWTFKLYHEYRNDKLLKQINKKGGYGADQYDEITFPAGTELKVDRIYIRKGASGYSSITFHLKKDPSKKFKNGRFWAKLIDVNRIEMEPIDCNLNILIQWRYNGSGEVNGKKVFSLKYEKIASGDYKEVLRCLQTDTVIGSWGTETTAKKHARKYIQDNLSLFLTKEQMNDLRTAKLKRVLVK